MRSTKKLLTLLLAVTMVFGLLACGKEPTEPDETSIETTFDITKAPVTGKIIISSTAALTISYEASGLVTGVEPSNDEGVAMFNSDKDYVGNSCVDVVADLVDKFIQDKALTKSLVIKPVPGSSMPNGNFLNTLVSTAQATADDALTTTTVILVPLNKLDAYGFIDTESAKSVVLAYLGLEKATTFAGSSVPDSQGYYLFYLEEGDLKGHYSVDATTGAVAELDADDPRLWEEEIDAGDEMGDEADRNAEDSKNAETPIGAEIPG